MRKYFSIISLVFAAALSSCSSSDIQPGETTIDSTDITSGGATTVFLATSGAFGNPAPNLSSDELSMHFDGDLAFEASFVTYPGPVNPGLGPIYNNISCASCHSGDGRGTPLNSGGALSSMLIRLSVDGTDEHGGPMPVPGFGGQLQQRAIPGVQPEGTIVIGYTDMPFQFDDGSSVMLRKPNYTAVNTYIPMPAGTMMSPRTAPPVFGLGLLEAVSEEDILSRADANDANGDGIRGVANYVWDAVNNKMSIGRFGWKANQPNLRQQTAGAYNGDMGITSPLFSVKSCHDQPQAAGFEYTHTDINEHTLAAATFYVQTLGVPARRNIANPSVVKGKQIFTAANCSGCHTPTMKTSTLSGVPAVSDQTIHPYTDLLLHDMGEGLSDGRPDFSASATQWRTQPLWGIGLTRLVNGHTQFLHDGRARNLMEAILWHDGEAHNSREYVKKLSQSDRDALIAYLNSL